MPEDRVIVCEGCSMEFIFTEGEQRYYEEKQFTPPKRCKPCRDERKRERQGRDGGGGERETHTIICSECGNEGTIPFPPTTGRTYKCRNCFKR